MKRLPHIALLLVAVALVAADKGEKEKSDAERFQGKWNIAEIHFEGEKQKLSREDKNDIVTFILSGKKLTSQSTNGYKASIELRPDKRPREMDVTSTKGEVTRAIYEISGDTLKMCFNVSGIDRPKKMGTSADDERALIVLKRVKGDDKK